MSDLIRQIQLAQRDAGEAAVIAHLESIGLAEPKPQPTQEQKDAARYQFLKARLMGADFDWNESGACVLVFEWPKDVPIGADCDKNIDAAMLAGGAS